MKILIVNTNENEGGAAKTAKRLYNALLSQNIHVQYLVDNKTSDNYKIIAFTSKFDKLKKVFRQQYDQLTVKFYKNRTGMIFSPNNTIFTDKFIKKIDEINPDIVHLHWVNGGMINIKDLIKINKPIVWTMHDSWLFTGGCHLPYDCQKFKTKCERCPVLGSSKDNDLSSKIFSLKKLIFPKLKLNIATPSNWLGINCKKSILLKDKNINVIPNPIDTDMYKPISKTISRELLRLPNDKQIILFGASSATSDVNKGFKQLSETIDKLNLENILLVVMGGSEPKENNIFKYPTRYLGHLNDDLSIKLVYNSADVSVVPSLSENLSNTIMESLACGTPVVGFDIGGNSDMIEHTKNGYLAKPFDTTDLKDGIEWVLNTENYNELCVNAREKVMREFDSKVVAGKYISLYEQILK